MKNFSIRRSTVLLNKNHSKTPTQLTIRTYRSNRLTRNPEQSARLVSSIIQAWSMVASLNIEINDCTILKYLKRRMTQKSFRYGQIILDILKSKGTTGLQKKIEDFNSSVFCFEIEQMKEELEDFLKKRMNRDMEIVKQEISKAENEVKDQIDTEQYQRLICSFRPMLITNSTDLGKQYLALTGLQKPSRSTRMQQIRYQKLSELERDVCGLHNQVVLQKSDARLFEYFKVMSRLL